MKTNRLQDRVVEWKTMRNKHVVTSFPSSCFSHHIFVPSHNNSRFLENPQIITLKIQQKTSKEITIYQLALYFWFSLDFQNWGKKSLGSSHCTLLHNALWDHFTLDLMFGGSQSKSNQYIFQRHIRCQEEIHLIFSQSFWKCWDYYTLESVETTLNVFLTFPPPISFQHSLSSWISWYFEKGPTTSNICFIHQEI